MSENIQSQEQKKEFVCRIVEKYGNKLWHYTDINALNGILNNKEIWFCSSANMNDSKESKGFIEDIKTEVQNETGKKRKVDDLFKRIEERLKCEYPFVFCLSKAEDDAAQWERYAGGGRGVAIVFNAEKIVHLICHNNFIFNEEYYVYDVKKHQMKNIIVKYINTGELELFSTVEGMIDNLLLCATIHKHKGFSSEQEIRLAPLFVKDDDPHLNFKVADTIKKVYVLNLDEMCQKKSIEFEDLIDAIYVGPKSKQNLEDLKWYCKKIGLPKLAEKIYKSDCPLI